MTFDRVDSCTTFLDTLADRPSQFDRLGGSSRVYVRMRTVAVPSVTFVAGSSTAKLVDHESPRAALVVPLGDCGATEHIGRTEYRWASPHHAFFIPSGARVRAESTAGSFLRLDLDQAALTRIAAGMAGAEHSCGSALRSR